MNSKRNLKESWEGTGEISLGCLQGKPPLSGGQGWRKCSISRVASAVCNWELILCPYRGMAHTKVP